MLTLVTVIYGDDRRYRVELFGSVLSILQQRRSADTRVVVYTDRTLDDFPLPITQRVIGADEWATWTAGTGISHLVKLHLVRETVEQSDGPVIYFDTDTLFLAAPEDLADKLSADSALMHADEGPISGHTIWSTIVDWLGAGRDVCDHRLSRDSVMYNSGIVGVLADHLDALYRSADIAAALHEVDAVFSLDQFSTGVALGKQANIATCEDEVLHYWGWNRAFIRQAIDIFWRQNESASVDDLCAAFNPQSLARLPRIHWLDKLGSRLDQLRWQLNSDGRFACLALRSATRHRTSDPVSARHWLTVHTDFVEKQAEVSASIARRLQTALSDRYDASAELNRH